ncbi:MAG: hypothetical protein WBB84_01275, partial [Candidatus Omnitrophota bacterium]
MVELYFDDLPIAGVEEKAKEMLKIVQEAAERLAGQEEAVRMRENNRFSVESSIGQVLFKIDSGDIVLKFFFPQYRELEAANQGFDVKEERTFHTYLKYQVLKAKQREAGRTDRKTVQGERPAATENIEQIIEHIREKLDRNEKVMVLVDGDPGTGKTDIIAPGIRKAFSSCKVIALDDYIRSRDSVNYVDVRRLEGDLWAAQRENVDVIVFEGLNLQFALDEIKAQPSPFQEYIYQLMGRKPVGIRAIVDDEQERIDFIKKTSPTADIFRARMRYRQGSEYDLKDGYDFIFRRKTAKTSLQEMLSRDAERAPPVKSGILKLVLEDSPEKFMPEYREKVEAFLEVIGEEFGWELIDDITTTEDLNEKALERLEKEICSLYSHPDYVKGNEQYTQELRRHVDSVIYLVKSMALGSGFDKKTAAALGVVAAAHDLGKLKTPEKLALHYSEKLLGEMTSGERSMIFEHTKDSLTMLKENGIRLPLEAILPLVLIHEIPTARDHQIVGYLPAMAKLRIPGEDQKIRVEVKTLLREISRSLWKAPAVMSITDRFCAFTERRPYHRGRVIGHEKDISHGFLKFQEHEGYLDNDAVRAVEPVLIDYFKKLEGDRTEREDGGTLPAVIPIQFTLGQYLAGVAVFLILFVNLWALLKIMWAKRRLRQYLQDKRPLNNVQVRGGYPTLSIIRGVRVAAGIDPEGRVVTETWKRSRILGPLDLLLFLVYFPVRLLIGLKGIFSSKDMVPPGDGRGNSKPQRRAVPVQRTEAASKGETPPVSSGKARVRVADMHHMLTELLTKGDWRNYSFTREYFTERFTEEVIVKTFDALVRLGILNVDTSGQQWTYWFADPYRNMPHENLAWISNHLIRTLPQAPSEIELGIVRKSLGSFTGEAVEDTAEEAAPAGEEPMEEVTSVEGVLIIRIVAAIAADEKLRNGQFDRTVVGDKIGQSFGLLEVFNKMVQRGILVMIRDKYCLAEYLRTMSSTERRGLLEKKLGIAVTAEAPAASPERPAALPVADGRASAGESQKGNMLRVFDTIVADDNLKNFSFGSHIEEQTGLGFEALKQVINELVMLSVLDIAGVGYVLNVQYRIAEP